MNYMNSKTYVEDLIAITSDSNLQKQLYGANVLVTGANGLIASVLTDALSYYGDINVYALCRSQERAKARFGSRVNLIVQDMNEPLNQDINFDYIIHAASNAHPLAYAEFPGDTMKANILGTINVLEYARFHKTKRIMFVSSSEVCGAISLSDLRSAYPESKRAAEMLCTAYKYQYHLNTVCVRPWYVYGATYTETSSRADAQFLRKALLRESIIMKSAGMQIRSYCYVADCVTAMLKILLSGENGAFNIAGKDDISIRQFAEAIANEAKVDITFQEADKIEQKGYTKLQNSVCEEQQAQRTRLLGYVPRYTAVEGIARTMRILHESV